MVVKHANTFLKEKRHTTTHCVQGYNGFTMTELDKHVLNLTARSALCCSVFNIQKKNNHDSDRRYTSLSVDCVPGTILNTPLTLPNAILTTVLQSRY